MAMNQGPAGRNCFVASLVVVAGAWDWIMTPAPCSRDLSFGAFVVD